MPSISHTKQAVVIAVIERDFGTALARRSIIRPMGRAKGHVWLTVKPGKAPGTFDNALTERMKKNGNRT